LNIPFQAIEILAKVGDAMLDLIIIGGGPSGSSAAQKAASAGLNVLLFEKEKFPRYKPCGGAVSERALSYIGHGIPDSLIENEIFGVRIQYEGQTIEGLKQDRIAILTARDAFDNYLLEEARAAGAEVRFEKILDFTEEDAQVRVTSQENGEFTAKYLIIAEGAQGNLKFKIKNRYSKDQYGFGIVTEIKRSAQNKSCVPRNLIEFQFGITPTGYGWIFPHKNHYSVGIVDLASHMKNGRTKVCNYLREHNFPPDSPLKGHIIPWGWPNGKLAGRRTLLCGDAGGFVDSFSGEGIAYAIRSGQIAAEKIAEIVREKRRSTLASYEKACREEFDENLHYSHTVAKYIYKFPALLFNVFTRDDKFFCQFLDIPIMKTTYKKVLFSLMKNVSIK
jgi:geranylgeranyl reductase family protein